VLLTEAVTRIDRLLLTVVDVELLTEDTVVGADVDVVIILLVENAELVVRTVVGTVDVEEKVLDVGNGIVV
jgi:ATP-dependent protease Clp ATPase subunit